MEENNEIDNFDLSQAKRNMAKMLGEKNTSAGLKKIFPDQGVVFNDDINKGSQTINIYPNQSGNDQSYFLNELVKSQRSENEKLREQVQSLKSLEHRLHGLELTLQNTIEQNKNLLPAPQNSSQKPWYFVGFSTLVILMLFVLINLLNTDSDQAKKLRKPAIVETQSAQSGELVNKLEKVVTTKFVNLRSVPGVSKSEVVKTISPNQFLEILESKGNWFRVKHFDYLSNKESLGWAYGEFLKKVD